jgi:hypothetical protein
VILISDGYKEITDPKNGVKKELLFPENAKKWVFLTIISLKKTFMIKIVGQESIRGY